MKRYAFLILLLALPMLYGQNIANTVFTMVYTQDPVIKQALHYTATVAESRLNYLSVTANAQFYRMIEDSTVTQSEWNEFTGVVNEFDRFKLAMDMSLGNALGIVTKTELAPEVRFVTSAYNKLDNEWLQENMGYVVAGFLSSLTGSNITLTTGSGMVYSSRDSLLTVIQEWKMEALEYNYSNN